MTDSLTTPEIETMDSDSFPCPACGGQMNFDPESQHLSCNYCNNLVEFTSEESVIKEYDLESAEELASHNWGSDVSNLVCESCGANSVVEKQAITNFCAYCGSNQIISVDDDNGIKPESLIPFKVNKSEANEKFNTWISAKRMAPRELSTQLNADKLLGVYIPHWTYDSDTSTYYTCSVGHDYYVTEHYTATENGNTVTKTRRVKKTRWHRKSGHIERNFDDFLVNASNKFNTDKIKALEPFHMEELVTYQPEYLSGFMAEKYGVSLQDGFVIAKEGIQEHIKGDIRSRELRKADHVRSINMNTTYEDVRFKHLLLPIWISSYTYKEKTYQYVVNGQTGEVQGEAPISWVKVAIISSIVILILASIYYYYYYL